MRNIIYLLIALFLLPGSLNAQEINVKRERVFTGTGLYGFMNGGAELFMEFGVEQLITRDIEYQGEEYTVDIYEMPTNEDAYGIYSMHVFRCECADTLGFINCLSAYQYQAVVGDLYVSIVFPSGTSAAKSKANDVLKYYVETLDSDKKLPAFPSFEGAELRPYSGQVKFVRGPLSAVNASIGMHNLLKDADYSGAWYAGKRNEDTFRAVIYFKSAADKQTFKQGLGADKILGEGDDYLYVSGEEPEEEDGDAGPFGF